MPCNNNDCNNGCFRDPVRRFDGYPYPVPYPVMPYRVAMPYPAPVAYYPECYPRRRNCSRPNGNGDLGGSVFKSITLGSSEILNRNSVPFNFNRRGLNDFIEHQQGDTNFVIKEDGLYDVSFKLNFIPSANGTISFVLRNNSTPITETFVITNAVAQTYSSVSFHDVLHLRENSIIDLHFSESTDGSVITVVDPLIVFEKID